MTPEQKASLDAAQLKEQCDAIKELHEALSRFAEKMNHDWLVEKYLNVFFDQWPDIRCYEIDFKTSLNSEEVMNDIYSVYDADVQRSKIYSDDGLDELLF